MAMKESSAQLLRWTFIGPLFGVALSSPVIWYFASPFDHSPRSLWCLTYALPISYVLGIPSAFLTGILHVRIHRTYIAGKQQPFLVIFVGALASTYLLWLALGASILQGRFDWNWLPSAAFFAVIGGWSTIGMLIVEKHLRVRATN